MKHCTFFLSRILLPLASLFLLPGSLFSQQKKTLQHADVHRWRKIEQQRLSNDGKWVAWSQVPVTEGDAALQLWSSPNANTIVFPRGVEGRFSEDSKWLIFRIKQPLDSLKALRRKKVKEEDLPKDSLGIYNLEQGSLEKIPRLKNVSVPEKWSNWIFYQIEPEKPAPVQKDTSSAAKQDSSKHVKPLKTIGGKAVKKPKKEDKENGYRLIVRHMASGGQDTIAYVKDYVLAKRAANVLLHSTGIGDTILFPANRRYYKTEFINLIYNEISSQRFGGGRGSSHNLLWKTRAGRRRFYWTPIHPKRVSGHGYCATAP